ncbi:MAG: class I SAM-dependent methyltransferase [Thermoplasmatota archaeon]
MPNVARDLVPEGWDEASDRYERFIAPLTARYAEDALRAADVRAGERLLDVAAGTGALTFLAAKRGARVLATDFAPAMIDRLGARVKGEKLDGIETRVMDGQRLALPDASFDVTASVFGLIFFPDRVQGLREMRRVLRPGGRAVIATWSRPERVQVVTELSSAVRAALPELPPPAAPPAVFSMADPHAVAAEFRAAGFSEPRVETVEHTWDFPDAEALWRDLAPASPVFTALLATLSPDQRERTHATLIQRVRASQGDGPVRLAAEAHVFVATKP